MHKLLFMTTLLLTNSVNFAMTPLVKNLSKVSKITTQHHLAKSLPCMVNQKRNSGEEAFIFAIALHWLFLSMDLSDIEKEVKKTNKLLEEQNNLLKEQLQIKKNEENTEKNR